MMKVKLRARRPKTSKEKNMEIKKLSAEHYDELLELLNYAFGAKEDKPVDFLSIQPKMWVRDDEHMGCHVAAFEDGKMCAVVGVYPLRTVIDGEEFLFVTTGNVATHPDYEGRGYFNALFTEAMKMMEEMGADAGRLGGLRARYGRFGYEGCGWSYLFNFYGRNRVAGFGEDAGKGITFSLIAPDDAEALIFCSELRANSPIYVKRPTANIADIYRSMCSRHNRPYLAVRDGKPVGYVCCKEDDKEIEEMAALDVAMLGQIVCAWQAKNPQRGINFAIPAFDKEALRMFCATAESYRITYPSRFKICNFEGITNAMMRYHARENQLLDGQWTLGIEGYGNIRLFVRGGVGGCEKTDDAPDLTLAPRVASRLLFGPDHAAVVADLPPIPRSWLPLPFSWGALDAI